MPRRTPESERERMRSLQQDRYRRIYEYLATHPCVDCGETNPVVLEFDHVVGVKTDSVSSLARRRVRWERILQEIEKCEVRCANCHRIRTFDRGKYLHYLDLKVEQKSPIVCSVCAEDIQDAIIGDC